MRDHKLKDIVSEVQKELPIKIPKFVISGVIKFFLKQMFLTMRRDKYRLQIKNGDINGVYKDYDIIAESNKQLCDLDETNEAHTPRIVLRSKINPKRVHYPRFSPDPVHKGQGSGQAAYQGT